MKYFSLIIITLFFTSCCNAKQVAANTSNKISKNTSPFEAIKTPEVIINQEPEVITASEVKTEITESVADTIKHATLHNNWNTLLRKHVSKNGNVNYKGFKNDKVLLSNYIQSLSENTPNNDWTKEDKLAYWINAYNAMTIDLILRHYPLKSIKDIGKPWDKHYWELGYKWYNLNEIEHEILRKMNEPRIHFAIVCASVSCPKLQNEAFSASNLDKQLTNATKEFLSDTSKNNITENNIKLSKIFQWFAKDFKQNGSLINFLNQYSDIKISAKAKKTFKDYNWNLNE